MPKTMLLTALVVEDLPHTRQQLVAFLTNQPIFLSVIEAANATEANELLDPHKPDVVFLDYDLGGSQTGFDVLRQLTVLNLMPQIVFTSGKDAEISSANLVNEFSRFNIKYFLEKPYKNKDLQKIIDQLKPKKLVAKGAYGDIYIDMSKILYMYIENRRLRVCHIFENNEVKWADLEGNLSDYVALLQAPNFLCLTSYIINVAQVLEVKGKGCIFKNGDELKLGTTNIEHLRAAKEHLDSL